MRYFDVPGVTTPAAVVCLGVSEFGTRFDEAASFALLDRFAEHGGNFYDSAHVYADWVPGGAGASERTLGNWLRSRGVRSRSVVATKGGHPRLETMGVSRLRPEDLARDIEESLARLRTDAIDLYYVHRDDPAIPVGEIMDALEQERGRGRLRAVGASNWTTPRLQAAADYTAAKGTPSFVASQIAWSLARTNGASDTVGAGHAVAMDDAGYAYYARHAVPVIPYTSQAGGFFAHPYDEGERRYAAYHGAANGRSWNRVQELAEVVGISPNCVALAYLLNDPVCGAVVVGAHTPEQIRDSCQASGVVLDPARRAILEGRDDASDN